jgi:hypothetical protein
MTDDIDIHELLAARRQIAHIWGIEDVQQIRPDLNDDQAWGVLKVIDERLDSEYGLSWDDIENAAEELFPEPDHWRGCIEVTVKGYTYSDALDHFTGLADHIEQAAVNDTTRATFDSVSLRPVECRPGDQNGGSHE